jgi:hypothetical protein
VIYDNSEQDRWVRLALDWFIHRINSIRALRQVGDSAEFAASLNDAAGFMWRHLCEVCATFKLDVFKEESEWRIVEIVPKNEGSTNVDNLRFRSKGGILIPYRLFPSERNVGTQQIRPLDNIRCGPTLSRAEVEQSGHNVASITRIYRCRG